MKLNRISLNLFSLAIVLMFSQANAHAASSAFAASGSAAGPVRVSGGVMAGHIHTKVEPVYPAEAREKHISGAVVLRAVISDTGGVEKVDVVSGPDIFQAAALEAVRHWTYDPYKLNGRPVEVETTVTVNFNAGK